MATSTATTVKYFSYEVPGWSNTQVCSGANWECASEFEGPHIDEAYAVREISKDQYKEIQDSW